MTGKRRAIRDEIRYSEAFKIDVVRELEMSGETFMAIARKYGILGKTTVKKWVAKYGNGTRGKIIRVQKAEEIDELKKLKERVRRLEGALADANIDLAMERAYTNIACRRAGIKDVGEFKKKAAGTLATSL